MSHKEEPKITPGNIHDIQSTILKNLGYRNRRTFSELQGDQPSNKVSFHLNKLNELGIIKKNGKYYETTEEGKSVLADLKFGREISPIDEVMVILFSPDGEIYLNYCDDNMDPLAESYRPIVKRLVRGERVEEKANELVEEETGKTPHEVDFAGILDMKTTFNEERFQHYMNLVVLAEVDYSNDKFYSKEEISDMHLVPGLKKIINHVSEEENLPFMTEWDLKSTGNGFELDRLTI